MAGRDAPDDPGRTAATRGPSAGAGTPTGSGGSSTPATRGSRGRASTGAGRVADRAARVPRGDDPRAGRRTSASTSSARCTRADADRRGHARSRRPRTCRRSSGRRGVVPGVLRARRRLRPRVAAHPRERDGDDYVLNGQKIWCSFGQIADFGEFLVRTDPDAPKHRGISWLILPMDTPGIEVRPLRTVLGSSEFSEVFLTDVRAGEQPRRRGERRLAGHERDALVRARHRVRERARRHAAAHRRSRAAGHRRRAPARARPLHRGVRRAVGADEAQRLAGRAPRRARRRRDGDEARVLGGPPALRRAVPARARPRRASRSTATSWSRSACARSRSRSRRAHRRSSATSSANGCSGSRESRADR